MAKIYLEKLSTLVETLKLENDTTAILESKHFFSGAALYADKKIFASWIPAGLAFKLPEAEVEKLIKSGKAKPLKYFEKGRIKKGYSLFETPEQSRPQRWKSYFLKSLKEVGAFHE